MTPSEALLQAVDALEVALSGIQVGQVGGKRRVVCRSGLREDVEAMLVGLSAEDLVKVAGCLAFEAAAHLAARRGERGARARLERLRMDVQLAPFAQELADGEWPT